MADGLAEAYHLFDGKSYQISLELGTVLQDPDVIFDQEYLRKKLEVVLFLGAIPKAWWTDLDSISSEKWVLLLSYLCGLSKGPPFHDVHCSITPKQLCTGCANCAREHQFFCSGCFVHQDGMLIEGSNSTVKSMGAARGRNSRNAVFGYLRCDEWFHRDFLNSLKFSKGFITDGLAHIYGIGAKDCWSLEMTGAMHDVAYNLALLNDRVVGYFICKVLFVFLLRQITGCIVFVFNDLDGQLQWANLSVSRFTRVIDWLLVKTERISVGIKSKGVEIRKIWQVLCILIVTNLFKIHKGYLEGALK